MIYAILHYKPMDALLNYLNCGRCNKGTLLRKHHKNSAFNWIAFNPSEIFPSMTNVINMFIYSWCLWDGRGRVLPTEVYYFIKLSILHLPIVSDLEEIDQRYDGSFGVCKNIIQAPGHFVTSA